MFGTLLFDAHCAAAAAAVLNLRPSTQCHIMCSYLDCSLSLKCTRACTHITHTHARRRLQFWPRCVRYSGRQAPVVRESWHMCDCVCAPWADKTAKENVALVRHRTQSGHTHIVGPRGLARLMHVKSQSHTHTHAYIHASWRRRRPLTHSLSHSLTHALTWKHTHHQSHITLAMCENVLWVCARFPASASFARIVCAREHSSTA